MGVKIIRLETIKHRSCLTNTPIGKLHDADAGSRVLIFLENLVLGLGLVSHHAFHLATHE